MQLVYRMVMQWGVTLLLLAYHIALYSKSVNPTLHINDIAQLGTR